MLGRGLVFLISAVLGLSAQAAVYQELLAHYQQIAATSATLNQSSTQGFGLSLKSSPSLVQIQALETQLLLLTRIDSLPPVELNAVYKRYAEINSMSRRIVDMNRAIDLLNSPKLNDASDDLISTVQQKARGPILKAYKAYREEGWFDADFADKRISPLIFFKVSSPEKEQEMLLQATLKLVTTYEERVKDLYKHYLDILVLTPAMVDTHVADFTRDLQAILRALQSQTSLFGLAAYDEAGLDYGQVQLLKTYKDHPAAQMAASSGPVIINRLTFYRLVHVSLAAQTLLEAAQSSNDWVELGLPASLDDEVFKKNISELMTSVLQPSSLPALRDNLQQLLPKPSPY